MTDPRTRATLLAPASLVSSVADVRDGGLTLAGVIDAACARLDAVQPQVRAILPEEGRAARLHAEAEHVVDGPLRGALVACKDIFAVTGMPTRAGSALPAEAFAMPEGQAVARLRAAGALVFGKSVTTEFAYFDPGATANPHDPRRTPGGSSSGSAAAVAAGIVPLALGSQTVGSVIRPAAFCGVVGVKPTYERIPTDGVLYYSPAVDHVGFFTQDVASAQRAAAVLLTGWHDVAAPSTVTLGVPDGAYLAQAQPAALEVFERTLATLRAAGVRVKRIRVLDDIAQVNHRHTRLITGEFHRQHRDRFARYGTLYRGGSAALFDTGATVTAEEIQVGLASREVLRARLTEAMQTAGIDAWASPAATGPAPLGLASTGDPAMNLPWTHAHLPVVTLPAGRLEGMPLGLQLAGRLHADEALLALAALLEPMLAVVA